MARFSQLLSLIILLTATPGTFLACEHSRVDFSAAAVADPADFDACAGADAGCDRPGPDDMAPSRRPLRLLGLPATATI